jgi:hypothetical protein
MNVEIEMDHEGLIHLRNALAITETRIVLEIYTALSTLTRALSDNPVVVLHSLTGREIVEKYPIPEIPLETE